MKLRFISCVLCCVSGVFCFSDGNNPLMNKATHTAASANIQSEQYKAETALPATTKLSNEFLATTKIVEYPAISGDVFDTSTPITGYSNIEGTNPALLVVEIIESSPVMDDPADIPALADQTSNSRKLRTVDSLKMLSRADRNSKIEK